MEITTNISEENIKNILNILEISTERMMNIANLVDDIDSPLLEGKRSFKDTVAHLIHCDIKSTNEISLALMKKGAKVEKIHSERDIGKLFKLKKYDIKNLFEYFRFRRAILLGILKELKFKDWERFVIEGWKKRNESVFWKCRGLALHEKHHFDLLLQHIKLRARVIN